MWTYYGSKANIVGLYPPPKFDTIIEPFAGSARYALKYWDKEVVLIDKYEVIVGIWKWLQKCSVKDIDRLPHKITGGKSMDEIEFDCEEAKNLLGFLIGYGMPIPRKSASVKRMKMRPNHVNFSLNKIKANLHKIKHWNIILGDYKGVENKEATWFVDPPYQFGGHAYKHSNKQIDFTELGDWCRTRNGQVIVCEKTNATWMEFNPLAKHKGASGMQSEGIWTNMPTSYSPKGKELFNEQ